jgi:hypothetical protein
MLGISRRTFTHDLEQTLQLLTLTPPHLQEQQDEGGYSE